MSVMGTRFLVIGLQGTRTWPGPPSTTSAKNADARRATRSRAWPAGASARDPYDKAEIREPIIALATYVARARSPVDRDSRGKIRLVLDPEAPTRIVKMLTQFWRACGLLGLDKPNAWELVRRVGMDSIPKLRRSILDYLGTRATTATTMTLPNMSSIPAGLRGVALRIWPLIVLFDDRPAAKARRTAGS